MHRASGQRLAHGSLALWQRGGRLLLRGDPHQSRRQSQGEHDVLFFLLRRDHRSRPRQVGWATIEANCEANVGFDAQSYGYRDVDGSAVHNGRTKNVGMAAWDTGDVIGCALWQPDAELPGQILFLKNGVPQGAAFTEVPAAVYFPAVSLFDGAAAAVNLGPVFTHRPQLPFEWASADALDSFPNTSFWVKEEVRPE
jgi:hypothetical protein